MAVITYVSGTISLIGDWTKEMINDVNIIRKCFVYDFYNEDSDIDELGVEDAPDFYVNARRTYGSFIEHARYYIDDKTKQAHDRLCLALKGKKETYILISFHETVGFNDEIDEEYGIDHEAKICLYENKDGTIYLQGEMIGEDEYHEKLGYAYDEFEKPIEYCSRCNEPVINCECTACFVCSEMDCVCPKCPECEKIELFCECGYDWTRNRSDNIDEYCPNCEEIEADCKCGYEWENQRDEQLDAMKNLC